MKVHSKREHSLSLPNSIAAYDSLTFAPSVCANQSCHFNDASKRGWDAG